MSALSQSAAGLSLVVVADPDHDSEVLLEGVDERRDRSVPDAGDLLRLAVDLDLRDDPVVLGGPVAYETIAYGRFTER